MKDVILVNIVALNDFALDVKVIVGFLKHCYKLGKYGTTDNKQSQDGYDTSESTWLEGRPIFVVEGRLILSQRDGSENLLATTFDFTFTFHFNYILFPTTDC